MNRYFTVFHRFLTIQGKPTDASEMAHDSTANAYSSYYSTEGLTPSKRGTREVLIISMKVRTPPTSTASGNHSFDSPTNLAIEARN